MKDLANCESVCFYWRQCANDDKLWRKIGMNLPIDTMKHHALAGGALDANGDGAVVGDGALQKKFPTWKHFVASNFTDSFQPAEFGPALSPQSHSRIIVSEYMERIHLGAPSEAGSTRSSHYELDTPAAIKRLTESLERELEEARARRANGNESLDEAKLNLLVDSINRRGEDDDMSQSQNEEGDGWYEAARISEEMQELAEQHQLLEDDYAVLQQWGLDREQELIDNLADVERDLNARLQQIEDLEGEKERLTEDHQVAVANLEALLAQEKKEKLSALDSLAKIQMSSAALQDAELALQGQVDALRKESAQQVQQIERKEGEVRSLQQAMSESGKQQTALEKEVGRLQKLLDVAEKNGSTKTARLEKELAKEKQAHTKLKAEVDMLVKQAKESRTEEMKTILDELHGIGEVIRRTPSKSPDHNDAFLTPRSNYSAAGDESPRPPSTPVTNTIEREFTTREVVYIPDARLPSFALAFTVILFLWLSLSGAEWSDDYTSYLPYV